MITGLIVSGLTVLAAGVIAVCGLLAVESAVWHEHTETTGGRTYAEFSRWWFPNGCA